MTVNERDDWSEVQKHLENPEDKKSKNRKQHKVPSSAYQLEDQKKGNWSASQLWG